MVYLYCNGNLNDTVTDTFEYDTYGKLISRTGSTKILFMYNGRDGVVTDDNGLIYMRARYYSPELRRFINSDIIAGKIVNAITLNRYAYANGNPVSFVDPLGLSVDERSQNYKYKISKFENEILLSTVSTIQNPWNELDFPGLIHNEVVRYLANKHNLQKEYSPTANPHNRYDLYSPKTSEFWEVKFISYLTNKEWRKWRIR